MDITHGIEQVTKSPLVKALIGVGIIFTAFGTILAFYDRHQANKLNKLDIELRGLEIKQAQKDLGITG